MTDSLTFKMKAYFRRSKTSRIVRVVGPETSSLPCESLFLVVEFVGHPLVSSSLDELEGVGSGH